MPITCVFFDLDGTLVDTTWFHTLAWWRALHDHGRVVPMADIHPLIGMGGPELMNALFGDDDAGIRDAHDANFKEYRELATPLPGASDLLLALKQRPVRLVLVTSSKPDDAEMLVRCLECGNVFDDIVHSEEAERTKPEPDLFNVALARVSVPPEEALAVGDAAWDVQAAAKAGVGSIGVETGGTGGEALRRAGAIEVYRSCREILRGWSSGPLADAV